MSIKDKSHEKKTFIYVILVSFKG